jgi:hypothetical protein
MVQVEDGTVAVCESCAGDDDDDLQPVWPASGTGESPELWCAECRAQLPHELASDGEDEGDDGDEAR